MHEMVLLYNITKTQYTRQQEIKVEWFSVLPLNIHIKTISIKILERKIITCALVSYEIRYLLSTGKSYVLLEPS